MNMTKHTQKDRRFPVMPGPTGKSNETVLFPQMAARRRTLALSAMPLLGLGAMAFFTGCQVTVREPGVVVSPPAVAVETPAVVVAPPVVAVTPGVTVDVAPVVLEEGIAVNGVVVAPLVAPEEYVLIGGRYSYWNPSLGRWFYRPAGWRPPAGYRVREARELRELGRLHQEVRHEQRELKQEQRDLRRDQRDVRQEQQRMQEQQKRQQEQQKRQQQQQKRQEKKEEKKKE